MPEESASTTESAANAGQGPQLWVDLIKQLPDTSWGYLCSLGFFAAQLYFIWTVQKYGFTAETLPDQPPAEIVWASVPLLGVSVVCMVFYYFCIFRFHKVACNTPGWTHPISAPRAVGFHFIPLYNVYWVFKWPAELGRFLRWCMPNPGVNWQYGLAYLTTQLLAILNPPVGVLAMFGLCGYVRWRMQVALQCKATALTGGSSEAFSG